MIDGQDFILGDTFLRNAYAVFNYGSLVGQSNAPFIQIMNVRSNAFSSNIFITLLTNQRRIDD